MNILKFGIAGYGKMGKIRERSLANNANTELVAIYEMNDHKCEDKSVVDCNSFEELLNLEIAKRESWITTFSTKEYREEWEKGEDFEEREYLLSSISASTI